MNALAQVELMLQVENAVVPVLQIPVLITRDWIVGDIKISVEVKQGLLGKNAARAQQVLVVDRRQAAATARQKRCPIRDQALTRRPRRALVQVPKVSVDVSVDGIDRPCRGRSADANSADIDQRISRHVQRAGNALRPMVQWL